MKKQNTIEVLNFGEVEVLSVKAEQLEFNRITQLGNPLIENTSPEIKQIENEIKALNQKKNLIKWKDKITGEIISNDKVFYDVFNNKVQKINKSEKISEKKQEIVGLNEVFNLTENQIYICFVNDTTKAIFRSKLGNDKSLKIKGYKKSSVGFSFCNAYLFFVNDTLCMMTGIGNLREAIQDFNEQLQNSQEIDINLTQKVAVNSDEIEIII